jgi:hypothetical protein
MAYDGCIVDKVFVGHVRFAADGSPEFATGWNDVDAPKTRVANASNPSWRASRWWFDAYATSSRTDPFEIVPCRCGAKAPMPALGRAGKPFVKVNAPGKPFVKVNAR